VIRALAFDIGSVLIDLDSAAAYRRMGFSEEACKAILAIPRLPGFWDALDKEELTLARGAEIFASYASDFEKEAEYAFYHMTEYVEPIRRNVEFLRRVRRAGYPAYYLSNFQRQNWGILRRTVDFFHLFEGGVVSHQVGHIKPEPEIYQIFLERYCLKPETTLFIDDREENTAAARSMGFGVITFQEGMDLFAAAEKYGLRV